MRYFTDCKTIEDVKVTYHKLVKELHPDNGGDAEQFKSMMNEYKIAFDRYKNIHATQSGETYEKEPEQDTQETAEQFAEIINKVIHFEGVKIEIIGSWVWLTGNTMIYKDQIKDLGFFWSKSKVAWYYNGSEKKTRRRGRYNMDGLRSKWGSTTVKNEKQEKLA